jgi:hypothetical protein
MDIIVSHRSWHGLGVLFRDVKSEPNNSDHGVFSATSLVLDAQDNRLGAVLRVEPASADPSRLGEGALFWAANRNLGLNRTFEKCIVFIRTCGMWIMDRELSP